MITKITQSNGIPCRRARPALRAGLRGLAVLGILILAACDISQLGAFFNVGGEGATAEAVNQERRMSESDIMTVQESLADLGYAPGPADGVIGGRTRRAIRSYQAAAGMEVNGRISMALLKNLRNNPVQAPTGWATDKTAEKLPPPYTGRVIAKDDVVIDSENDELAPVYEVGDQIAWSDGLIETVVRVGGGKVFWRGSDGTSFNADPVFVIPPSSWDGAAGPGSAEAAVETARIWPWPRGKRINFKVSTTGPSGDELVRDWTCRGRGRTKLTVPAGTFDTLVITCSRGSAGEGEWVHRTWFYAPAARHYVRRVDRFADGSIRAVGLVAIRPGGKGWPAAARAGLGWAVQEVLSERAVGTSTDWGSTSVNANFEIMPTGSRTTAAGETCRTYVLIQHLHGGGRSYPAIACKASVTGTWLVPVLDKDALPAGAVTTAPLG